MRLGLDPLTWDRYTPIELYAMEDAESWRRSRDLDMLAVAVLTIANRIPWSEGISLEEFRVTFPWYRKPDDTR